MFEASKDMRLYHACMMFCESYCELLEMKEQLRTGYYPPDVSNKMISYHEKKVRYYFGKLCEVIDEIKGDEK